MPSLKHLEIPMGMKIALVLLVLVLLANLEMAISVFQAQSWSQTVGEVIYAGPRNGPNTDSARGANPWIIRYGFEVSNRSYMSTSIFPERIGIFRGIDPVFNDWC